MLLGRSLFGDEDDGGGKLVAFRIRNEGGFPDPIEEFLLLRATDEVDCLFNDILDGAVVNLRP